MPVAEPLAAGVRRALNCGSSQTHVRNAQQWLCGPQQRLQGFLEYWDATSYASSAPPTVSFTMKLDTNLFDLAKAKTVAHCIEVGALAHPGLFSCSCPAQLVERSQKCDLQVEHVHRLAGSAGTVLEM